MLMKPHVKIELDRMRRNIGMRAVLFMQSKARYPEDDYYDDEMIVMMMMVMVMVML